MSARLALTAYPVSPPTCSPCIARPVIPAPMLPPFGHLQLPAHLLVQSTQEGDSLMPFLEGLGVPPGKVRASPRAVFSFANLILQRGSSLLLCSPARRYTHTSLLRALARLGRAACCCPTCHCIARGRPAWSPGRPAAHPRCFACRSAGSCWVCRTEASWCKPPRCRRARCADAGAGGSAAQAWGTAGCG